MYKVNLKTPSITPIAAPDEPASAMIGYAHKFTDAKAILYLHAANIVAEAEAKLRRAQENARFIYNMPFEQPDFIEVEAVAVLPIDEPVPDEWFPVLMAAELQREMTILDETNDYQTALNVLRDAVYINELRRLENSPVRMGYIKQSK